MKSTRSLSRIAVIAVLVLLVCGCDNGGSPELTTTSSLVGSTIADGGSTTTSVEPGGESTTTTTLVGESVESYDIVTRVSETAGETLYIVIPPGAYTDVDIENFVIDRLEDGTLTYGAEIFEDADAAAAFKKDAADRTEDEKTLIETYHLATLVDGSTIVFQGPLSNSGQMVIGS
jgi:hypothetical protein